MSSQQVSSWPDENYRITESVAVRSEIGSLILPIARWRRRETSFRTKQWPKARSSSFHSSFCRILTQGRSLDAPAHAACLARNRLRLPNCNGDTRLAEIAPDRCSITRRQRVGVCGNIVDLKQLPGLGGGGEDEDAGLLIRSVPRRSSSGRRTGDCSDGPVPLPTKTVSVQADSGFPTGSSGDLCWICSVDTSWLSAPLQLVRSAQVHVKNRLSDVRRFRNPLTMTIA